MKQTQLQYLLVLLITLLISFNFFNHFNKKFNKKIKTVHLAIVVPHHDLVKDIRKQLFTNLSEIYPDIKSVILVGPDHFGANRTKITSSNHNWQLKNGTIEFDDDLYQKLNLDLNFENNRLKKDHAIFNLLADIENSWPQAKIIPILIGDAKSFNDLNKIKNTINNNCINNCILIASVDFSHYMPRSLASIHDAESISALQNREIPWTHNLEVDSPQSLYLLSEFAKYHHLDKFNLVAHTNSGWIENNRDAETTTHVMGVYSNLYNFKSLSTINNNFYIDPYTFMVANNLNQDLDQIILGDRFFYGLDEYKINNNKTFTISNCLKINFEQNVKSQQQSEITFSNGSLHISLNNDLVVAGIHNQDILKLVFLPIKKQNQVNSLLKEDDKTLYLKTLLNKINNEKIKINTYEGTLEMKCVK